MSAGASAESSTYGSIATDPVTLTRFLLRERTCSDHKGLAILMQSVQLACKSISQAVRKAGALNLPARPGAARGGARGGAPRGPTRGRDSRRLRRPRHRRAVRTRGLRQRDRRRPEEARHGSAPHIRQRPQGAREGGRRGASRIRRARGPVLARPVTARPTARPAPQFSNELCVMVSEEEEDPIIMAEHESGARRSFQRRFHGRPRAALTAPRRVPQAATAWSRIRWTAPPTLTATLAQAPSLASTRRRLAPAGARPAAAGRPTQCCSHTPARPDTARAAPARPTCCAQATSCSWPATACTGAARRWCWRPALA